MSTKVTVDPPDCMSCCFRSDPAAVFRSAICWVGREGHTFSSTATCPCLSTVVFSFTLMNAFELRLRNPVPSLFACRGAEESGGLCEDHFLQAAHPAPRRAFQPSREWPPRVFGATIDVPSTVRNSCKEIHGMLGDGLHDPERILAKHMLDSGPSFDAPMYKPCSCVGRA